MCEDSEIAKQTVTGCSILLVEDNAINQKVVTLMLGKIGLDVDVASSGMEAVSMVSEKAFNLILMDLHMPGIDGVETARQIHELLKEKCPPIVALTADILFNLDGEERASRFSGFLTKPVSSETLRSCIHEHTGIA